MQLGYDKNGSLGTFTPQYNGNISGTIWKSEGDQQKRKYDFTYDAVNRLTSANFNQYASGTGASAIFNKTAGIDFSLSNLTFDANGNILTMNQAGLKLNTSPVVDQLRYTYIANSNKLQSVKDFMNDPVTKLGDFKTNTTHPQAATKTALTTSSTQAQFDAITDYAYDLNGNLTVDNNKSISSITYNHLNLPLVITITGKGTIGYTYDATGNKLKKVTTETNATVPFNGTNYTSNIITTTTYLGGAVYESKDYVNTALNSLDIPEQLQFIAHEEGRIRFVKATTSTCPPLPDRFVFDYFVKDHLGNVRTVLTEQNENICYIPATVEDANFTTEQKIYNIVDARRILKTTVGAPQASFQNKLYQTHGGIAGQKTGLGVTLKVMAGDKVKIFAESYYTLPAGGSAGSPVNMVLSDLLSAFAGSGAVGSVKGTVSATDVQNLGTNNTQISSFITRTPSAYTTKAYLNWILFDDQLKYVRSGAEAVGSSTSAGGGVYKQHIAFTNAPVNIEKSGFFYVFVSNESNLAVFFDNLVLTHTPGPILEETHYYPFGLTMSGISSKALYNSPENRYKFNDATELNNDFGLGWYETMNRSYDPQIGRFWQIDEFGEIAEEWSPYVFAYNNPILYNDPLGLFSEGPGETSTPDKPKELGNVTVVATKQMDLWAQTRLYYRLREHTGGDINRIVNNDLRERMVRIEGIVKHRERVAEMTRASDKIFLEGVSWFIPTGALLKITKLRKLAFLFKWKRGKNAVTVTEEVIEHSDDIVKSGVDISKHAAERLVERGITEKMVETAIEKGVKYFDPKNKTFAYVIKNGFASGKDLLVGVNTLTGKVTTVIRGKNLVKSNFIPQ